MAELDEWIMLEHETKGDGRLITRKRLVKRTNIEDVFENVQGPGTKIYFYDGTSSIVTTKIEDLLEMLNGK